ncbi:MAG: RICIN domain-containing protein [Candidatus Bathyarchaeota archaeon]|nr:RICIN domain-containing protein [Candidatus Termitimicrobium sp.]
MQYQNERLKSKENLEKRKKDMWWSWVTPPTLIWKTTELIISAKQYDKILADLLNKTRQLEENIRYNIEKIASLKRSREETGAQSSELAMQMHLIEMQISEVINEINVATAVLGIWERLQRLYEIAVVSIENSFTVEKLRDCFEAVIELGKQLDVADETVVVGKTSIISGMLYRGNALYLGQVLKKGEYLASLNKRFVAVLKRDGTFAVANGEKEIWYTAVKGDKVVFGEDGLVKLDTWNTKRGGASILIMQDDGNLVTYNSAGQPLWATDTWTYATIDAGAYNIPLTKYSGTYKIMGQNNMCFDVFGGRISNAAILQLYPAHENDNQKFNIEPLSNGAHKITVVCGGKALDIRGGSKDCYADLIQYTPHNGPNQQFWIVPCKDDYVKIIPVHSGKPIDVAGGNFAKNAKLQQNDENGTQTQMFKLINA